VFALYDEDKTGYVSIRNLRKVAQDVGEDISEEHLQLMLTKADSDKDGYVSASEFYAVIARIGK
jgi:Ca2+-binding EF-hand superfamily protein